MNEFILKRDWEKYFTSKVAAYVFVLNNTDGYQQNRMLQINARHYKNFKIASAWKDDIEQILNSAKNETGGIPMKDVERARARLYAIYGQMIGANRRPPYTPYGGPFGDDEDCGDEDYWEE